MAASVARSCEAGIQFGTSIAVTRPYEWGVSPENDWAYGCALGGRDARCHYDRSPTGGFALVPPPLADTISLPDTLALLDGPFAELAANVANGAYAIWLGSGVLVQEDAETGRLSRDRPRAPAFPLGARGILRVPG